MIEIIDIDDRFVRDGRRAADEGQEAYESGKSLDDCPYEDGSYSKLQWKRAFVTTKYHDPAN